MSRDSKERRILKGLNTKENEEKISRIFIEDNMLDQKSIKVKARLSDKQNINQKESKLSLITDVWVLVSSLVVLICCLIYLLQ